MSSPPISTPTAVYLSQVYRPQHQPVRAAFLLNTLVLLARWAYPVDRTAPYTISMSDQPDPNTLLISARRFEPGALAALHDLYYPQVFRYVSYRLEDLQTAEDISAEVFLRLLDFLKHKKGDIQNLKGWLFGTAHHLVQDHYRAGYRRPVTPLDDHHHLPSGHSPEAEAEQTLAGSEIRQALRALTADQQHVIALRFSQELTLQETAQVMKKSVEAVKVLQFRALGALRRQMEGSR